MRIRKRKAPFPLSSFSPVPLSDPHLIDRSPVVQLNDAPPPKSSIPLLLQQQPHTALAAASHLDHPQPLPPMGKPTHPRDSPASGFATESMANDQDPSDEDGIEQDGAEEKRNDTRKRGILGSDTATEDVPLPPLSPSNQDGRWREGEKAIPLKKRRGRGGEYMNVSENNSNTNKKMKTRMKTKMNKKCTLNDNDENHGEEEEESKGEVNGIKKRGKGSGEMEGSRCSRVNGRGWRCFQQTLVGYSLCEHHLGKGRLRSITSVRSRTIPTTASATKNNISHSVDPLWGASSSSPEKKNKCDSLGIHDNGEHKDEKKPVMITKKRMKLGMVKARSISSLLGQTTDTRITQAENNK